MFLHGLDRSVERDWLHAFPRDGGADWRHHRHHRRMLPDHADADQTDQGVA